MSFLLLSKRSFFYLIGWLSLILGIIGIFLPIVPTVPFIFLSAFCFSKSSVKMQNWIMSKPYLGPAIKDWNDHQIIRKKAKILSTIAIIISFASTIIFVKVFLVVKVIIAVIGIILLVFIWSRKSI